MQITVKNAAKLLSVSVDKIYQWIKQEDIPYIKVRDQYYFDKIELFEWAKINGIQISTEIFSDKKEENAYSTILYDSLVEGGVHYNVPGNDVASVLKSVVGLLKLPDDMDRDFLYEVLLAREALGSTGIGNGIAIPHSRNPLILDIKKPSITLCFLEKPIEFNAIDGKPVTILFTILSNTVNIHLKMLSRLAYTIANKDFLEFLLKKPKPNEIIEMIKKFETEINERENKKVDKYE